MHRLVPLGPLAALVLTPAAAQAVTKTDTVTASVRKTGRSGTALVYKGTVRSKVFGRGTVVEKIYGGLRGTFVITYRRGKVRGRTTAKATPVSNGVRVSGTFRITGGTGRYRRVRGHGTYTGHSNASLSRATFRQRGRVSY